MQVFPVGCIDNGNAVYVHVAAPHAEAAEEFVKQNRPYLTIINTLDSVSSIDAEKVHTVRVSKEPRL